MAALECHHSRQIVNVRFDRLEVLAGVARDVFALAPLVFDFLAVLHNQE